MKHLGDLTKLKGNSVPLVDVVTGGSPCQNLSVAGNREGLGGNESRLFLEQVRLVKEMRDVSKQIGGILKPRYLVWENVKGALSCNGGEDFRRVLEEIARIKEPNTSIPRPPKNKWVGAGAIMGDGWSIAWRLHDSQFWGVPQRRKRIALVADFDGYSAPEILFERKSVHGRFEQGKEKREEVAISVGRRTENTGETIVGINGDIAGTLDASYYKGAGQRGGVERDFVLCVKRVVK